MHIERINNYESSSNRCGSIANSAHIPSYLENPDAEIKYFCDVIPERAKAAVEKYDCGIAIDSMRAGKHVLCEKPAARTYKEACEMQKVQHETGKVLNTDEITAIGA